jgi:hypothetical protein
LLYLRTSDWEIPNCRAMRAGVIPALNVARMAFTSPRVNATPGSSDCRHSEQWPTAFDSFGTRLATSSWDADRISGAPAVGLPHRCSSCWAAASNLSNSMSSNCWRAFERALGSAYRGEDLSAMFTTAPDS